tara:strand:- start:24515 stop:26566 length:2052 start_codon:yes stop_codon:yes gene_type:complete
MSVLDRKMFKKVAKLAHGGNPNIDHNTGLPLIPTLAGGMNAVDTSIYQTNKYMQEDPAPVTTSNQMQGIVAGLNEFQPIANQFAQELFPEKTAEEYAEEAKLLYTTDYGAEKASIEAQKEADVASSLINFGARLLTGRGKALDVLGQAVQQTLPEFSAARRVTRKEEQEVRTAEKAVEAQRKTYALTKAEEDKVARANIMSQAMFSNLGFFQELAKQKNKNDLDLSTTFKLVTDRATNLNTEITLEAYLKDLELPEDQRKYSVAKDYTEPFIAYDKIVGENKFFTTYEEFAVANAAEPTRYGDKKDFRASEWKKVINLNTGNVEFVESEKLNPSVHVPADSVDYIEVMDTKNNNKLVYHPKNMPLDTDRYVPKQEPVNLFKDFVMGSFTHPATGEYGNWQMKEMKDGTYLIPSLDSNGDMILQANGSPVWTTIGTGLADLTVNQKVAMTAEDVLPRKALTEMFATIQLYDRNINSIDQVIANLVKDSSLAGFPGLIQDIKQRGFGMIADLIAADDQISLYQETLKDVQNSFSNGKIETAEGSGKFVDVNALFDPNSQESQQFWGEFKPELAENRVRINAIAYAVARARKSSGRLNLDDIARAYESLKVTGLIDSKTVISALTTVREELRLANNDMKVLYKMNKGEFPDDYVTSGEINPSNVPKVAFDPDTNTYTDITFPGEIK